MADAQTQDGVLTLTSGEALNDADRTTLWRLESGALRVETVSPETYCGHGQLILPGDLIGLEHLAGVPAHVRTHAIISSRLVRVDVSGADFTHLLLKAAAMGQRRCRTNVSLRSGQVAERIKRLFLILADAQPCVSNTAVCELPALKDIAAIVDTSPETVSRVIGGFRQLQLMSGSRLSQSALCLSQLRAHLIKPGMTSSVGLTKQKALSL